MAQFDLLLCSGKLFRSFLDVIFAEYELVPSIQCLTLVTSRIERGGRQSVWSVSARYDVFLYSTLPYRVMWAARSVDVWLVQ